MAQTSHNADRRKQDIHMRLRTLVATALFLIFGFGVLIYQLYALQLRDAEGGPEVLIGAGVNPAVITRLRQELPRAAAFHMSGKTLLESGMRFRRADVPMGLPGLDEWHIQQTDEDAVRAAVHALYKA